jgi:hypothetical protein
MFPDLYNFQSIASSQPDDVFSSAIIRALRTELHMGLQLPENLTDTMHATYDRRLFMTRHVI